MDTRVKERLVGAAVLVGIIVALVPEMLSGPRHEKPAPASGDQVRTYTIDLSREAGATGPPREVIPSEAPTVTPAPPPEAGLPEESPETSAEATAASSAAIASPQESSTPSPATTAPATAQGRPATPKPEAAVGPAPQERETAAVDSGWAVQLGSFASQGNAERLAKDMQRRGYRAFVSQFGSGTSARYRVRVGPERDRPKAEALAQRLRRDGQQVSIVAHP